MAKKQEKYTKKQGPKQKEIYNCALPKIPPRELPSGLTPNRLRLIRLNEKKWANGTLLHYYFFDRPTDGDNGSWVGAVAQKDVVRNAFQAWKDLGIGLEFREVSDREDAEIRIGFMGGDGSWSYVGRDVIDLVTDPNERTMNFGWDLTTPYGWDTALHEIGHTLGFPHEHQNPYAGIVWNEQAVYDYFSGYPNYWDPETIDWNILRKLSVSEVTGSDWDSNSIMHYQFPAGVIEQPIEYAGGLFPEAGLSPVDIEEVRRFYPPLDPVKDPELKPYESQRLMIAAGEQVNFRIRPRFTRRYTIQTFGQADTVMVLFEEDGIETIYIQGDDDSGFERNALLRERLYRGREYILRVRLYYSDIAGETAVFMY
jgi:hypothetical protein